MVALTLLERETISRGIVAQHSARLMAKDATRLAKTSDQAPNSQPVFLFAVASINVFLTFIRSIPILLNEIGTKQETPSS